MNTSSLSNELPSAETLQDFLRTDFPQSQTTVIEAAPMHAVIRYAVSEQSLRPGATVSGPAMMAAADIGLYVAILATIGIKPLTVTTNFSINFLRKPAAGRDIIATCTLLKVGKTLAIGEVSLSSAGDETIVAHAVGTYSIPPS